MGLSPSSSHLQYQLYNAGEPLSPDLSDEVKPSMPNFVSTLSRHPYDSLTPLFAEHALPDPIQNNETFILFSVVFSKINPLAFAGQIFAEKASSTSPTGG